MIYLSIVDKDNNFREEVLKECKKILSKYDFMNKCFDSLEALMKDEDYLKHLQILMIDEKFINEQDLKILNNLIERYKNINIMFYGENLYLIPKAYEVKHFYFVLKSKFKKSLRLAIAKGLEITNRNRKKYMVVNFNSKIDLVPIHEIIKIEHQYRKIELVTKNTTYCFYATIDEILEKVGEDTFIRISQSEWINPKYIKTYNKTYIILQDDKEVNISRAYVTKIREKFTSNNYNFSFSKTI